MESKDDVKVYSETRLSFDKKDVAAVALAKVERKIRSDLKSLEAKKKEIDKKIKDIEAKIGTITGESRPDNFEEMERIFKEYIRVFGYETKKEPTYSTVLYEKVGNQNGAKEYVNSFIMSVHLYKDGADRGIQLSSPTFTFNVSIEQGNLILEKASLVEEETKVLEEMVENKKKISEMAYYERQLNAAVIESELNQSDEGKRILDGILKTLDIRAKDYFLE